MNSKKYSINSLDSVLLKKVKETTLMVENVTKTHYSFKRQAIIFLSMTSCLLQDCSDNKYCSDDEYCYIITSITAVMNITLLVTSGIVAIPRLRVLL